MIPAPTLISKRAMNVTIVDNHIHPRHHPRLQLRPQLRLQIHRPSVRTLDNTVIHLRRAVEHMCAWTRLVKLILPVEEAGLAKTSMAAKDRFVRHRLLWTWLAMDLI